MKTTGFSLEDCACPTQANTYGPQLEIQKIRSRNCSDFPISLGHESAWLARLTPELKTGANDLICTEQLTAGANLLSDDARLTWVRG